MRHVVFNLGFYLMTLLLAVVTVPVSLVAGDGTVRGLFALWARGTVWLVRHVLGARVEIRGREHIVERPALLVSKHQSELDVALMGTVFPDYGAIAMRELDDYPLVGGIVRKLGHIKVTVEGERKNQLPQVLEGARRVHSEGRPILIYPEGTLMHPGRKSRYRGGVWHLYDALQVPATPVALSLGLAWPRREWKKYPTPVALEFLEPIPPGLPKQEFMALLEERIETATNALIREQAPPARLEEMVFEYEEQGGGWSSPKQVHGENGP